MTLVGPTASNRAAGADALALVLFDMQGTLLLGAGGLLAPPAVALVHRLARAPSLLLGVATNLSRHDLDLVLTKNCSALDGIWLTTQTRSEAPAKPNPAMARRAMDETGAAPERTVMIGDGVSDMQMARAAGVAAIGVLWSGAEPDVLRRAGAQRLVEEPGDVERAVLALIGPVDGLEAP